MEAFGKKNVGGTAYLCDKEELKLKSCCFLGSNEDIKERKVDGFSNWRIN